MTTKKDFGTTPLSLAKWIIWHQEEKKREDVSQPTQLELMLDDN